jgi:tetratricopeptide (TPR) repeat protein
MAATLAATLWWASRKARRELPDQEAGRIQFALISGTLLLVLPLLLTLNLNALNPGDFLHGRYTYLPLAGLMLIVAAVWRLMDNLRYVFLCAAVAIAVVFALLTISQEKQWKDDATIFMIAHGLAPHNGPVAQKFADTRVQAALRMSDDGRCSEAIPVFDTVLRDYPQDWYAWAGRGYCFVQLNEPAKAEESLHRAADISHDSRVIQQWQELRVHMGLPDLPASK